MKFLETTSSRRAAWVASACFIFASWLACAAIGQAQGQPPKDAAETAPAKAVTTATEAAQSESLASIIMGSGVIGLLFYAVLAVFSIAALAIILERLVNLRRDKVVSPALVERLLQLVRSGQATKENLESLCRGNTTPLAIILEAGVLRAGRPISEVEKGVEEAAAWELYGLRARHRFLSVIATVAPLVGLLGTVVGMIIAFRVSASQGLGKGEMLARGIYIALLTTAIGLMIAIPCLMFAAWFNTRIDSFIREINACLTKTMPCFSRLEVAAQPAAAASTNGTHQPAEPAGAGS